jgi:SHS2 domain-containing protein
VSAAKCPNEGFDIIDHTADIGIRVYGVDPGELYVNAVRGMFSLITDCRRVHAVATTELQVEGQDWPDLMVNWLREALYLWNGKEWLVRSAIIETIDEYRIRAMFEGEAFDPDRHLIQMEIKAVTYHQIEVKQRLTGWTAKIIFDV